MYAWQAIQESIDYIENHYQETIDVETLASIAHLSQYYYQRLFHRLTHKTVNEYVKLRRTAMASELLKKSSKRILEIALECGFINHSSLTRAFKEIYGITPKQYRQQKMTLDHFQKIDLSLNYTLIDQNVPLVTSQMVLEIEEHDLNHDILFAGKSKKASVKDLGEAKVNYLVELWKDLKYDERQIGVDILTPDMSPEYFHYFVGVEVIQNDEAKEMRIMPKGKYMVCRYEAENFEQLVNDALYKASQYLYDVWLPHHHLQPDALLIQKYFHPFSKNCYIELWAKLKEEGVA